MVRALIIPASAFVSAYLVPDDETTATRIAKEAHNALTQFLAIVSRQRKQVVESVDNKTDLTRAIEQIASAAGERQAGKLIADVQRAILQIDPDSQTPKGPVSPAILVEAVEAQPIQQSTPEPILKLVEPRLTAKEVEHRCREAFRDGMARVARRRWGQ